MVRPYGPYGLEKCNFGDRRNHTVLMVFQKKNNHISFLIFDLLIMVYEKNSSMTLYLFIYII